MAAFLIAAGSLRRAILLEPLPGSVELPPRSPVRTIDPRPEVPGEVLVNAILNDPFRPDRQASTERFVLPEKRAAQAEAARAAAAAPAGPLKLLGTVVLPDGGAAMVEGSGEARMVEVGQSFLGHRLKDVERGRAVFVSPAGTAEVLEVDKRES
ncbi:MAG: hypothetical protein ACREMK_12490 [Gemmatimonadota bacterium]